MKDASDNKTQDFIGGGESRRVDDMLTQAKEDLILAEQFKLVAVKAYVKNEEKADKLTANNKRQKEFVERKKAEGLTKAFIPAPVADAIKAEAGGFTAWVEKQRQEAAAAAAVPTVTIEKVVEKLVPVEKIVEKIVEKTVIKALSSEQIEAIELGQTIQKLTGWRRALVKFALG